MHSKQDDPEKKKITVLQLQRCLVRMQEIGDQKLHFVAQIIERIENKTRQLEQDLENLGELFTVNVKIYFSMSVSQVLHLNLPDHN